MPICAHEYSRGKNHNHDLGFEYKVHPQHLAFFWNRQDDAQYYRLLGGTSEDSLVPVAGGARLNSESLWLPTRRWLLDWDNSFYRLEACASTAGDCDHQNIKLNSRDAAGSIDVVQSLGLRTASRFGSAVAISANGNTMAVGVPGGRWQPGGVQIFTRKQQRWQSQAWIADPDSDGGNNFGVALAISADGSVLAVGAPGEDSDPNKITSIWRKLLGQATTAADISHNADTEDSGAAYIFRRSGRHWHLDSWLKATNADRGDAFGSSLSISANAEVIAIGAPGEDSAARSRHGFWKKLFRFFAGTSDQGLGAIGVNDNLPRDNQAADAGAVYIFVGQRGQWREQIYLKASNTDAGDGFGQCTEISADGNTLAVGAPYEDSNAIDGQSLLEGLFTRLAGDLTPDSSQTTDDDPVQNNNDAAESGAVYVYLRHQGKWFQQAWLKAANTDAGDRFGCGLALTADGNTLAVGAPYEDSRARVGLGFWPSFKSDEGEKDPEAIIDLDQQDNRALDSGAVYVYRRSGRTWFRRAYLKPNDNSAGNAFGHSLVLSDDSMTMAVASVGVDAQGATPLGYWRSTAVRLARGIDKALAPVSGSSIAQRWRQFAGGLLGEEERNRKERPKSAAEDSGAVYLFNFDKQNWRQTARLDSDSHQSYEQFGYSLAMDADNRQLVVGVPGRALILPGNKPGESIGIAEVGAVDAY